MVTTTAAAQLKTAREAGKPKITLILLHENMAIIALGKRQKFLCRKFCACWIKHYQKLGWFCPSHVVFSSP